MKISPVTITTIRTIKQADRTPKQPEPEFITLEEAGLEESSANAAFDLDETVINSSHRTPNHADGTLNLDAYIALHTPENVAKDTLLPLAATMQRAIAAGYKVAILTARDMSECDYEFLKEKGIHTQYIYSRDRCKTKSHYSMRDGPYKAYWFYLMPKELTRNHCIMFDDAKPVKTSMRALGVTTMCAQKLNKKLFTLARGK